MSEKVKVAVIGIKDAPAGGGCGHGCGGCGPKKTMGEVYNELAMFLENSMVKDNIEMEFVDITQRDLKGYESADKAIEKGFAIPMTLINGAIKFTGEISRKAIFNEIKKFL